MVPLRDEQKLISEATLASILPTALPAFNGCKHLSTISLGPSQKALIIYGSKA
jgi:hypothetical protein